MPIVYKTVTYALHIDNAEEGLDADAKDSEVIAAAESYSDDSWEEVDSDIFVEALDAGHEVDEGDDFEPEEDDFEDYGADDDDGEFVFDEDSEALPEFPSEEEDY